MSDFPVDVSQLVGLFMEAIFYGIFLVTFGMCMNVLVVRKPSGVPYKWTMIIVSLLMFTFATLDVAFGLRFNLDAFIYYTGPGGAVEEFAKISYWVNVMKSVDYCFQTYIGDIMLLYRCYIVWGKSYLVIAFPLTLLLGEMAMGSLVIYTEKTFRSNAFLGASRLSPYINSFFAITTAFNIITTALIVFKIWSIDRQTSRYVISEGSQPQSFRGHRLRYVMRIIIESGLMYTFCVVVFICVYASGSNAQYGVSDSTVQIIGIVFNLIIIRVDQRRTLEFHNSELSNVTLPPLKRDDLPLAFIGGIHSVGIRSDVANNTGLSTNDTGPIGVDVSASITKQLDNRAYHSSFADSSISGDNLYVKDEEKRHEAC